MKSPPYILLYDRDCGICSAVSRWIRTLDWRGRIRLQSIQSSRNILVGIPEDRMLDALHVVSPDGHVTTGGDAVPTLIGAFPIGAGVERVLRGSTALMGVGHRFYGFVTRFRDRLVCRLEPAGTSAAAGPRRGGGAGSRFSCSPPPRPGILRSPAAPRSAPPSPGTPTAPSR